MAFDPTKPTEDSELDAAQMRGQLNGLNEKFTALQAENQSQVQQLAARAHRAAGAQPHHCECRPQRGHRGRAAPDLVREPARPRGVQRDAGQIERGPERADAFGVKGRRGKLSDRTRAPCFRPSST